MSRLSYERLSAQDMQFLVMESENSPMDIVSIQIFEMGPMHNKAGGLDIASYRTWINSLLHRIPRYRQKLKWIPYLKTPVWVDDPQINLDYHIRHTALPRPGSMKQLKHMAARIMVNQLDRMKPLWELWFIEGLEKNRFALITKIHHCMLDGIDGLNLTHVMLSTKAETSIDETPLYVPRPEPSSYDLFSDEIQRRARFPMKTLGEFSHFLKNSDHPIKECQTHYKAVTKSLHKIRHQPPESPFNGELSYHRRCEWMEMPLDTIMEMRKGRDCTVNDILLAIVTGAIRKHYIKRGIPTEVECFRIAMPVKTRPVHHIHAHTNQVSHWLLDLPIGEENPISQLKTIMQTTQELKAGKQAMGMETIMDLADWAPSTLLPLALKHSDSPFANSIVTSVAGPSEPLYLLGARLIEIYPQVPLLPNVGLSTSMMSYDGRMFCGFNADFNLVPDIDLFRRSIWESFEELHSVIIKEPLSLVHDEDKEATANQGGSSRAKRA